MNERLYEPCAPVFHFFDQHGREVEQGHHSEFESQISEFEAYYDALLQSVSELEEPKPVWFVDAEQRARQFIQDAGLSADVEIVLVNGTESQLKLLGFMGETNVAVANPVTHEIYVHKEKFDDLYATTGHDFAASILVHEQVHQATDHAMHTVFREDHHKDSGIAVTTRKGWRMARLDKPQTGGFLEEGFAEFMAGLYRRRATDPDAPLVPNMPATLKLPDHFKQPGTLLGKPVQFASGPDGYAIEIISNELAKRGILPVEEFIELLIKTRTHEHQAQALRQVSAAINQLQPGLYKFLRNLNHSKEHGLQGLEAVYQGLRGGRVNFLG